MIYEDCKNDPKSHHIIAAKIQNVFNAQAS